MYKILIFFWEIYFLYISKKQEKFSISIKEKCQHLNNKKKKNVILSPDKWVPKNSLSFLGKKIEMIDILLNYYITKILYNVLLLFQFYNTAI